MDTRHQLLCLLVRVDVVSCYRETEVVMWIYFALAQHTICQSSTVCLSEISQLVLQTPLWNFAPIPSVIYSLLGN